MCPCSFNIGRVHIIVLNSWDEARGNNTRQMQWATADLQSATKQTSLLDFIIVMFHHAPYSRGACVCRPQHKYPIPNAATRYFALAA